jgi:putative ABC transport system permease protein
MISKLDLKYTFRQLSKKPGFVLLAILVLAGGLGISLMAFTISYSMTYKTLPITNGERIYHICTRSKKNNCGPFNAFEFAQVRPNITTMENIGIYFMRNNVPVIYEDTQRISSLIYTEPGLFSLSASNALLGRTLQPFDQDAGAERVVVIGYDFWQEHLDGAEDVIGKHLTVAGEPARIVGVMPQGYKMPWSDQLWMPVPQGFVQPAVRSLLPVNTFALLKNGVSEQAADAEINNLVAGLRTQYPYDPATVWPEEPLQKLNSGNIGDIDRVSTGHINVFPLSEFGSTGAIAIIFLINIFTVLIFLLACINAGTLLLARTNERLRDISIRVALGAPRLRLFVQTLGENIVIVVVGGVVALLFAGIGLELINLIFTSLNAQILAFWMEFRLDGSTVAGVLLFMALTILLTGGIPIWRIVNGNFNAAMRDGTRGALGLRAGKLNRALVVTSISIVTVLVALIAVTGSLIYPEMKTWTAVPDNGISVEFRLDGQRYDAKQHRQFRRALTDALMAEPSIAYAIVQAGLGNARVQAETVASRDADDQITAQIAASGYSSPPPQNDAFTVANAPVLLEGRVLNEFDQANTAPVIFISRALAEALWPGESALNKRLRIQGVPAITETWREVVGVYGTSKQVNSRLLNSRAANLSLPFTQLDTDNLAMSANVFARSPEQLEAAKIATGKIFASLDSDLEVQSTDLGELLGSLTKSVSTGINLALTMGAFTFLVAITGIYGLTQNAVQMATQEIGTRRALGATDKSVGLTFLRRGSRQLVQGFLIAVLIAAPFGLILVEIATSLGVSMQLPLLVMGSVLVLLYSIILVAIFVPVRRILRMEPAEALHYE